MINGAKILASYDDRGIVYDCDDYILRSIRSEFYKKTSEVLDFYKKYNLSKLGIVQSEFELESGKRFLKHKKYLITYPYEWSAEMLKDAALFHVDLWLKLNALDLSLKDAHLNNILFDLSLKPVFIDFFSLVKINDLKEEFWLQEFNIKDRHQAEMRIFNSMFFPYVLIPLILMKRREYKAARIMLSERSCNISTDQPCWKDLFLYKGSKNKIFNFLENMKLYFFFKNKNIKDIKGFYQNIFHIIKDFNVSSRFSNYISYYKLKNEDFDFQDQSNWKKKQKSVFSVIEKIKPKSVLDLGANTGWFSILSAKMGASVISTDIDEASVDFLYYYSKKKSLNIVPLFLPFNNLDKEIYGMTFNDKIYESRDLKNNPIYLSPTLRLKSEVVLCLALLHHLVLGDNLSFNRIMKILSDLTSKCLVLEFVDLSDLLVKYDPPYFMNINNYDKQNYNIELVIKEGMKYFRAFKVLPSNSESRKLLIFEK